MKNIINMLLLLTLCFLIQLYFPWYCIVLVAGLMGAFREEAGGKAFFNGFISLALLWMGMAIYLYLQTTGNLTMQMSQMTGVPVWCLFLLTGIIGGITGGLSCCTGYLLNRKSP